MALGIDPKVDFAFKLVFGSPDHTAVTIHFLNSVLAPQQPITAVEILNPIQGKDRSEDKLVVLDVLAEDAIGRKFNIEMQTTLPVDLAERLTYYGCLNLVKQLGEGDAYYQMRPSISICVLNRNLYPQIDRYHLSFRLRCDQEPIVFSQALEFHTLELPKFRHVGDNVGELPPVEKWLYFLLHAENMDADELSRQLSEPAFAEAVGVLEMIARTPEDRQFYEARQKFLHDEQARLIAARQEGREEGERIGLTKGKLAGQIQMLQGLLGESKESDRDLEMLSVEHLQEQLAELEQRFRNKDV